MVQAAQARPNVKTVDHKSYRFTINIASDEMTAHLKVEPIKKSGEGAINVEEITEVLNSQGIVAGINTEQLEKFLSEELVSKVIEAAKGTPPEKGKDAAFELLFENAGSKAPVLGDDGFIDYKNLNLINNATQGQPLAKKIPPTQGKPGITVTGKKIDGILGKDKALPKGKNTDVSPDNPDLLIAVKDGSITYTSNLISIDDTFKVNSDVDTATGNLDFVGSIVIAGMVHAGFSIKAAGNIEIGKNIEDAEINCGGSLVANGGFVGSGKGVIKAGEDVFLKYVENQTVFAGHDVNIGGSAMNANITANNAVVVTGNKAVIVGGKVTAANLIEAGVLGSDLGTSTTVRVGYNKQLIKEYREIETEMERLKADGEKIHKAMYTLVRLEIDNKLNAAQKVALAQLKEQQVVIPAQLEKLELRKTEIITKLNENKKAKIVANRTVYPGTTICIGMLKREINKVINGCTFGISHDQIVIMART